MFFSSESKKQPSSCSSVGQYSQESSPTDQKTIPESSISTPQASASCDLSFADGSWPTNIQNTVRIIVLLLINYFIFANNLFLLRNETFLKALYKFNFWIFFLLIDRFHIYIWRASSLLFFLFFLCEEVFIQNFWCFVEIWNYQLQQISWFWRWKKGLQKFSKYVTKTRRNRLMLGGGGLFLKRRRGYSRMATSRIPFKLLWDITSLLWLMAMCDLWMSMKQRFLSDIIILIEVGIPVAVPPTLRNVTWKIL